MRFCMVTTFYPPFHFGGDAMYVQALSRALAAEGHEIEIVHCTDAYQRNDKPAVPPPEGERGITVHRLASRFGVLSPLISQQTGHPGLKSGTLRTIFDRQFDIVHFHNVSLIGGPTVLSWSRAPVTLYTLHEHWLVCPTHILWKNQTKACDGPTCMSCCLRSRIPPQLWRYTGLRESSVHHVDTILSPSQYTADRHANEGLGKKIEVLPLFSAIRPGAAPLANGRSRACFLFVGRVTASKGIRPLLETFAQLPEYDLRIIGDGDLRVSLQQRFAACPNIRFLGQKPQTELAREYAAATALVFPSLAPETFGLSIVEAFACGTPCIVRDAGGCSEPVRATGGGILYRSDAELPEALHQLAGNPALRDALGAAARAGYLRHYTPDRHLARYWGHIRIVEERKRLRGRGTLHARDPYVS